MRQAHNILNMHIRWCLPTMSKRGLPATGKKWRKWWLEKERCQRKGKGQSISKTHILRSLSTLTTRRLPTASRMSGGSLKDSLCSFHSVSSVRSSSSPLRAAHTQRNQFSCWPRFSQMPQLLRKKWNHHFSSCILAQNLSCQAVLLQPWQPPFTRCSCVSFSIYHHLLSFSGILHQHQASSITFKHSLSTWSILFDIQASLFPF